MKIDRRAMLAGSLMLALTLVMGGCQAETGPIGGQPDVVLGYGHLLLSSASLQQAVAFQNPVVRKTDNGLMQVSQTLRSKSNEPLYLEYRVVWMDASGQPIEPPMTWRPLRLESRLPQTVLANATSTQASDYRFEFRWSRP